MENEKEKKQKSKKNKQKIRKMRKNISKSKIISMKSYWMRTEETERGRRGGKRKRDEEDWRKDGVSRGKRTRGRN